jgi:hypothetical protein
MAAYEVTWNSATLVATHNLIVVSLDRPSPQLRNPGVEIPGVSGYLTTMPLNEDLSPMIISLDGMVPTDNWVGLLAATLIAGYKSLKFGDQGAFHYDARCVECSMQSSSDRSKLTGVKIAWVASPPTLNAD